MMAQGLMDGPMKGHLGLKSSPFAPTDCKLVSQYMVVDHMASHYKKLNSAKACVDTTMPKAMVISQKMRDQKRREELRAKSARKAPSPSPMKTHYNHNYASSRATSDIDREEMMAMMHGLTVASGMDDVDYTHIASKAQKHRILDASVTDLEVNLSEDTKMNGTDMRLVDRIISDNTCSPSNYRSNKKVTSNIPLNADPESAKSLTPRSRDLMDTKSHKYTEQKPFTPRTLKSKQSSKLSQFKYYTPPKKKPTPSERAPMKVIVSRSETPATDTSMDIMMNETLMSRDFCRTPNKSGVPPLDISLDADHVKWLKDQTHRGLLRSTRSVLTRSEAGSDVGSMLLPPDALDTERVNGHTLMTLNREEEIKYLDFISDVTNDVLDRGIFTNRALKTVFESHLDKHKRELKVSKMRDMLDDLRKDLGIPVDDHETDTVGLTSMRTWSPDELATATQTIHHQQQQQEATGARASRRKDPMMTTQKMSLPTLKMCRRGSGEGKPPLPRPGSRGSRSRPGSSCSKTDLHELKEVNEEDMNGHATDILTIDHEAAKAEEQEEEIEAKMEEEDEVLGDTLKAELMDYEEEFEEEEAEDEEVPPPQPTPRKRSSVTPRSDLKETPRSNGLTQTTDSVTVSELDEDDSIF
ncbi:hypothetical protein CAPTEDRAFT_214055 [Capitella teleta]|uniref:Uncharacterized protein n=1 Tax=Capitella teleta TaxID=283909 RepID=R7TKQ1_CAPTE|nr:hypothetical protein CAPTEDRAFT_214055 [Capitella teleta]|eukprot:ELT94082.1 hypothetical protein CAPTEDRAFT_214055 [Capitella teleta]